MASPLSVLDVFGQNGGFLGREPVELAGSLIASGQIQALGRADELLAKHLWDLRPEGNADGGDGF